MNVGDPKTLLLVSWGNNNGHMAHCAAVGKVAKDAGWRVVVASEEDPLHTELATRHGFEILTISQDPRRRPVALLARATLPAPRP